MKIALRKIVLILILITMAICACKSGGGSGGDKNSPPLKGAFFVLDLYLNGGDPSGDLIPPDDVGYSIFERDGMDLHSALGSITMELMDLSASGLYVDATIRVTNTGGATLQRVWLITKVQDGGEPDESTADGFIGDGVYYFLKNIDPGEAVTVHVFYNGESTFGRLTTDLDVVTVADRIGFEYFLPEGSAEPWTINLDGADSLSLADLTIGEAAIWPTASPDGGWVAFSWQTGSLYEVGLARTDGLGAAKLTCFGGGSSFFPGDFTKDGKKLYVRHATETLGWSSIYLLDIKTAREDCSSVAALTPLTVSTAEVADEKIPAAAPDGSFILYARYLPRSVEPPYANGAPNPTACPNWTFGTEMTYTAPNLYLMPTDPDTGLPTGPEQEFWNEDSLAYAIPFITPDSQGVILKAGGCQTYQYYCSAGQWKYHCITPILTTGMYRLNIPDDWSVLPYNYADNPTAYTFYPGFVTAGDNAESPNWCWQSNRVVFTSATHFVYDCDPLNCASDRRLLFNESGLQAGAKCTPAVADP